MEYRDNIDENLNLKNLSECKKLINKNRYEFIDKGSEGEVLKVYSK